MPGPSRAPYHSLPEISPPSLALLLLELRVLGEIPKFAFKRIDPATLPHGDGHAVLVLPGFGADDFATFPLRRALSRLGYAVHGWEQGRNLGMRSRLKAALALQVDRIFQRHGPVSLIGWSLGGVFAREIARQYPEKIRRVVSLGSPINGRPDANNLNTLFAMATRTKPAPRDVEGFLRRTVPPPVPCTAIFTRQDGIVAWPCCLEPAGPNTENVEVSGSHLGLVFNDEVLRILAQRLAQPVGTRRRGPAASAKKEINSTIVKV